MFSLQTTSVKDKAPLAVFEGNVPRWGMALALPLAAGPLWCLAWQSSGSQLGTLAGFVLVAVLGVSAITDMRCQKIFNWATYSALLWALAINTVATVSAGAFGSTLGGFGLGQCLAGAGLCFLVTLLGYDLSGGGAGDVKLAAVIGALLGVHQGVCAIAYSYVIAAVVIVTWTIWTQGPTVLFRALGRAIGSYLGPLWPFAPSDADAQVLLKPVALGPYFAIGTLLVAAEAVPI